MANVVLSDTAARNGFLNGSRPCPLTPALRKAISVWIAHRLPDDEELAALLFISPATMRTNFQRIHEKLGTHSKVEILFVVLQNGWETLPSLEAQAKNNAP